MKACASCGEDKPPAGFGKDRHRPDGLTTQCKDCRSERQRRRRALGVADGLKPCAIEACEKPSRSRGWCTKHYQRWQNTGDPQGSKPRTPMPRKSEAERFWPKVAVAGPDECWEWTGCRLPRGYGQFNAEVDGEWRKVYAHRWSYEHHVGPIPEGMTIDHQCGNPPCVNPRHLKVATQVDNTMRGSSPAAQNARKTHCVNGHEFAPENTYVWTNGHRTCKACNRERKRKSSKKEVAA